MTVYCAVRCYNLELKEVSHAVVYRNGLSALVTAVHAQELTLTICDEAASNFAGWQSGGVPAYTKRLAFYFDGDVDRMPDAIILEREWELDGESHPLAAPWDPYSNSVEHGAIRALHRGD